MTVINKDVIKGNWKEVKGKLRQQWGDFTDDEVSKMKGSYEELEGALQKKYGYKKDEARNKLDEFINSNEWE